MFGTSRQDTTRAVRTNGAHHLRIIAHATADLLVSRDDGTAAGQLTTAMAVTDDGSGAAAGRRSAG